MSDNVMSDKESFQCGKLGSDWITLRDFFAATALQGILSKPNHGSTWRGYREEARMAFAIADEMLEARKQKGK